MDELYSRARRAVVDHFRIGAWCRSADSRAIYSQHELRFTPPTHFTSTTGVTFTFHAWDQSNTPGVTSGSRQNISAQLGGAFSYSVNPPATATVVVNPVNDPPEFITFPTDKTVDEDGGLITFVAFVSARPGPDLVADENPPSPPGQVITGYQLSNTNNPLFTVQPQISASGVLTFTLAPDANGQATVTVVAQDNGPQGGANRFESDPASAVAAARPQTFVITVRPVNDSPVVNQAPANVSLAEGIAANAQLCLHRCQHDYRGRRRSSVEWRQQLLLGDGSRPSRTGNVGRARWGSFGHERLAGDNSVVRKLAVLKINSTLANLTYTTPTSSFNEFSNGGPVLMTVVVNDGGFAGSVGAANEPANSPTRTVSIHVTPTNDTRQELYCPQQR